MTADPADLDHIPETDPTAPTSAVPTRTHPDSPEEAARMAAGADSPVVESSQPDPSTQATDTDDAENRGINPPVEDVPVTDDDDDGLEFEEDGDDDNEGEWPDDDDDTGPDTTVDPTTDPDHEPDPAADSDLFA